jgi:hypothetical protein
VTTFRRVPRHYYHAATVLPIPHIDISPYLVDMGSTHTQPVADSDKGKERIYADEFLRMAEIEVRALMFSLKT